MEDDRFLKDFGREPRPEFARALRARLRAGEDRETARGWALRPAFAAAAAVLVAAAAFGIPAVRVSAQALLDLFRVRSFTAVPFDAGRLEKLRGLEGDHAMLVFDQEVLQKPVEQRVATPEAASAVVGAPVLSPGHLPDGYTLDHVEVNGETRTRLVADGARLQGVLETLGLRDVAIPPGLPGQTIEVHVWPVVEQQWTSRGGSEIHLVQSRSPEVALPAGVDLAQLGEFGLRVLGLDAAEVRRVSAAVDWHSTLVVPVPVNASSFREVTIRGNRGLLVTVSGRGATGEGRRPRQGAVVMWTEGEQIYALSGSQGGLDLVQIAESLR